MRPFLLLSLFLFLVDEAHAAPCLDFACDSISVREILDANGLNSLAVTDVVGTSNNRIDTLNLTGRGITILPAAVGNMSGLKHLFLGCIRFSGVPRNPVCNFLDSLPESIGKLSELVDLNLDGNRLVTLPQSITGLKKLSRLDIQYNNIASLPASVGELTEMEYLSLGYNPLTALPDEIGKLSKLRYISLFATEIQELPPAIGNWSNLQFIIIANTNLKTLPDEFGNLTSLQQAELYRNKVTSLPESIVKLNNLQYFFIEFNRLCSPSGDIRTWLDKYNPGWNTTQDCSTAAKIRSVTNKPLSLIKATVTSVPGRIELSFNLSGNNPVKIDIFDAQGKLLFNTGYAYATAGIHNLKLSTNHTIKGIVFVRMTDDFSEPVITRLVAY